VQQQAVALTMALPKVQRSHWLRLLMLLLPSPYRAQQ
jgi:hypothetical protein